MQTVYLSLGSNVGDRQSQLRTAITRLEDLGTVTAVSSFYETEPVEFTQQEWFVNCVVAFENEKTPTGLMDSLLEIERGMGRTRNLPKGPRIIDIDIILFADEVIDQPGLSIPHPAMHQRRFVLEPLAEIAPHAFHPVFMRSAQQLLLALPQGADEVRRLSKL